MSVMVIVRRKVGGTSVLEKIGQLKASMSGTAEAVEDKLKRNIPFKVGVCTNTDGSSRLLKGKNLRQPPMTGLRGFGSK